MSEWRPVMNPAGAGYFPGFDRERAYEFRRQGEDEVSSFRMCDQSPYFNVGGLYWREPKEERASRDWTKLGAYRS